MADLTTQGQTHFTPFDGSNLTKRPLASTAATYYVGQMVSFNSSGFIINAGDTASTLFAGVVDSKELPFGKLVVPSGGSNGDYSLWVRRPRYFRMKTATIVQADVGKLATIVDNQTVALAATTTNDIAAGRINAIISATEVELEILPVGQNA